MTAKKNFILDTNVLIENPQSLKTLRNGNENQVILPYTVLEELDTLKKNQRVAHIVSKILVMIQDDTSIVLLKPAQPSHELQFSNDDRILEEVLNCNIPDPILVTNDRLMQIKARLHNIVSEHYRDSNPFQSESQSFTGFVGEAEDPVPNSFQWENGAPVFFGPEGKKAIKHQHQVWNVKPRNMYQNLALELMLHEAIDLVTVQSEAGYGKTFLALASALFLTLEEKSNPYRKIFLVKPVIEIGRGMGYLPGDMEDKMAPYVRYIQDLLAKLHELRPANRIFDDPKNSVMKLNPHRFEILPMAYIRGMNIENAVVIIDEMQNLSRSETRALLTRMGEGVKCYCLGDTRQVDNPYLNESNNGLNWVVKKFKGLRNFAHIVLKGDKSRGPITDMIIKSGL
jgi:PhoH-like ATPase